MTQIPSTSPVDQALSGQNQTPNRFAEMKTEDFIKIIFTELSNQDPLKPQDSSKILQQLDSIRSIESDVKLTRKLEQLVSHNQLASASNLIGKHVSGRTADFQPAEGQVVSARQTDDSVQLELANGKVVPFENIDSVVAGGSEDPPAGTG